MTPKSDLSFEFQSISVTLEYLRLHTSLYCMFSPLHTDVHTRTQGRPLVLMGTECFSLVLRDCSNLPALLRRDSH